ncbi:LysR family transcriptional regulator, partial [Yersinia pestis]
MLLLSKSLRYFIITAQKESITLAADKLCITASPLSRNIKELEMKLGCELFTRTSKGILLTSSGHFLYDKIIPVYNEIIELEKELISNHKLNVISEEKRLELNIGTDIFHYAHLLPIAKARFFNEENVNFSLEVSTSQDISQMLRENIYQVFFSQRVLPKEHGIIHRKLSDEFMMIALQDDMYRDDMSQEDIISSYPLVQYPRQNISSVVDELTNYLISRKLNPIRITLPNVNDHLSIINQGGAIGILPSSVKKLINMHNYNIKLIPFVHKGEKLKVK